MLSWGEIVVVLLIGLLLFGADKIPEFARTAGKFMNEFQKVRQNLSDEINNVKDDLDTTVDESAKKENVESEEQIENISDDVYRNL